jgi:ketosteroid isomerase-like protein
VPNTTSTRAERGPGPVRKLLAIAASMAAGIAAAGTAASAPPVNNAAAAEVRQLESTLEQIYNSPQFSQDPSVALEYFDTQAMRLFDIEAPAEYRGADFRKHFIEIGAQFNGGRVEFSKIEVTTDGHLAFATSLQHLFGRGKDGKPYDMTMRVTDCLRKSGGRWLIIHEHISLPLDATAFRSVIAPKQ